MTKRKRTAVLISGRGSNMGGLIDAAAQPDYPAEIALVLSNVTDAPGLTRASGQDIPTRTLPNGSFSSREAFEHAVDGVLREFEIEIVCLAGFMRILSNGFVRDWEGRLLNIHPSLLPAFKGIDAHRQVRDAGVRISGCTVHYVVSELDSGPIIAQAAVPIPVNDSEQMIAARTLAAEHKLYPFALRLVAEGVVALVDGKLKWANAAAAAGELFSPAL
jgi:formyltetrahydrofolate-dependent phosphoribosylglycinamide formyltransferase